MILLIKKMPQYRNIKLPAYDNVVHYCTSIPTGNNIFDVDFGMFGQVHPKIKKQNDFWQIVEEIGHYRHVHYAIELPNQKFRIVYTMVYHRDSGRFITAHTAYNPMDALIDVTPHLWQLKSFILNYVLGDDTNLHEGPYLVAQSELFRHVEAQTRYELRDPCRLEDVNRECKEAIQATHHFEKLLPSWLSDIYIANFGNRCSKEMDTSPFINGTSPTEEFSSADFERMASPRLDLDTKSAPVIEEAVEKILDPTRKFITNGHNPFRSTGPEQKVITGELIMHLLTSAFNHVEVDLRYDSSADKLYITKGICANEFLVDKNPVDLTKRRLSSSMIQWATGLVQHLRVIITNHLRHLEKRVKTVNFLYSEMMITLKINLDDRTVLSLVIPVLELVDTMPIFMWDMQNTGE